MPAPKPIDTPSNLAGLKLLGVLFLMLAISASFVLALDHFALATPPGCGPQSGCDQATRSSWGTIPRIGWPTSLLGVAYFSGLLAAWLTSIRRVCPLMRIIVWMGAMGSIAFIGVMLHHNFVCKYCLATHVANFAFLAVMELAARAGDKNAPPRLRPIVAGVLTFIIVTAALGIVHVQTKARRLARDEADRQQSTQQIIARSTRPADTAPATTATASTSTSSKPASAPIANANPFTGRWRLGPENAPIRIVMFMDYQCHDCQQMESQVAALLQRRKDVSLSVKQFPMCADCNPHIGGIMMHPNACWAARAAEAAGILRGNDGFWQMHAWLFQNGGSFTDQSFPASLQQMGYDPNQFIQTMSSNNTLRNVLADVDEGDVLGLHFTPMIFINGIELRGFIGNPGALTRTVDDLVAQNLPPGDATRDHPAGAVEKYVQDWLTQPQRSIPPATVTRALGPKDAKTRIVVFGDLQDSYTAELDRLIQAQIAAGRGVRYEFRNYPADQSCNPNVQQTVYPSACIAARAAEAAGAIGSDAAYWKMHDWLLSHQRALNDDALKQAASDVGVDFAALRAAMDAPAAAAAIASDVQTGAGVVFNGMIPTLYINGKWVPRWKLEGEKIVERLIDAAERGQ